MTYEELLEENKRLHLQVEALKAENNRLRESLGNFYSSSLSNSNQQGILSDVELEIQYDKNNSPNQEAVTPSQRSTPRTDAEKAAILESRIALFRSLFKGREDVFARRWVGKNGRIGYSPVCEYEFKPEHGCGKPKIQCSDCKVKKWVPISDGHFYHHLSGKKRYAYENSREKIDKELIIGIYPLLEDNTTNLLCTDFDDKNCAHGYKSEVLAFYGVCNQWDIPAYIERSRSGNGAHVWIFFETAVAASKARRLGFAILQEAMQNNSQIDFKSYDRFFPNQDTLPKGGLGNLVALPLQRSARDNGNSVFVDTDFNVIAEQWEYMSKVKRLTAGSLDNILATHSGILELSKSSETKPWEIPKPVNISFEDFLQSVIVTRANMLYIPLKGISGKALNHLKRVAAFSNKNYWTKLNSRLTVYNIPSIISRSEITEEYLCLPRGCEDAVVELLRSNLVPFEIDDKTISGHSIDVSFNGMLYPHQAEAVDTMLCHNIGILHATTAFGKTVAAAAIIAKRMVNTLILVPTKALQMQWKARLEQFLFIHEEVPESARTKKGIKKSYSPIGLLDSGKDSLHGNIDIVVYNSALTETGVKDFVRDYGMAIVDECHHVCAVGFERVMKYVGARYVYGLTATIKRPDGLEPIMFMQCGPVRYAYSPKSQIAGQAFGRTFIPRFTAFRSTQEHSNPSLYFEDLAKDEARNTLIIEDVVAALEEGRTPIVLTKRKDHVTLLADILEKHCPNVIRLVGTAPAKERKEAMAKLQSIPADEPLVVVAIGKYVGEGFDFPRLDTLFIALPVAYDNIVQQYTGRLHREYEGKREVQVYDYIDIHVPALSKMYGKRIKSYAPIGYTQQSNAAIDEGPQDIIFNRDSFFLPLLEDIRSSQSTIILSVRNLRGARKAFVEAISEASRRGVTIMIYEKDPSLRDKELEMAGAEVIIQEDQHILAAVIDRRILWYGNINFTGGNFPEDTTMRIVEPKIASEVMGCLMEQQ